MKPYLDPLKCEWCASQIRHKAFVPPEMPRGQPKVIVVGEAPGRQEKRDGRPFVGPSGQIVRSILKDTPAIILNAVNTYSEAKPTVKQVAMCREAHLVPILNAFPGVPVISLGSWAATSLMGGAHSETSMAGEARWMYDRPVVFSYHPAYYLRSGRNEQILEHIRVHMQSAMAPPFKHEYHIDKLPKKVDGAIIIDVETDKGDLPYYGANIILLGIMIERGEQAYLFTEDYLKSAKRREEIQRRIIAPASTVIGHHLNFDVLQSEALGFEMSDHEWFDTELAIKDQGIDLFGGYGLKFLAKRHYQAPPYEAKFHSHWQLVKGKKATKTMRDFPLEDLAIYNTGDLYYTKRLAEARSVFIRNNPIFRLDQDYAQQVAQMVKNGIMIDQKVLKKLNAEYTTQRENAERKVKKIGKLGKDFNLGSWQQLLPVLRSIVDRDIPNTKEQTLEKYLDKHPIVQAVLDWRKPKKILEQLESVRERIIPATGLVHSTLNPHGAESGRSTSKEPNIENWQREMQPMMISRYDDGVLMFPDLSAIEYRLIAHATNQRDLISAFRKGADIHAVFYKQLFGRPPENDKRRKIAKTARYAKTYGAGFRKFLFASELDEKTAKHIYYDLLPGTTPAIDEYKEELADRLEQGPFWLENLFGRKRRADASTFPVDYEGSQINNALREYFNWLFQSAGHDILELFTLESMDLIDDPEVLLINDVHDEYILDVPKKKVGDVKAAVEFVAANLNGLIEQAFGVKMKVPITAELKQGKHWS